MKFIVWMWVIDINIFFGSIYKICMWLWAIITKYAYLHHMLLWKWCDGICMWYDGSYTWCYVHVVLGYGHGVMIYLIVLNLLIQSCVW